MLVTPKEMNEKKGILLGLIFHAQVHLFILGFIIFIWPAARSWLLFWDWLN